MDPERSRCATCTCPRPSGWWPLAPGWWVVIALAIAGRSACFAWSPPALAERRAATRSSSSHVEPAPRTPAIRSCSAAMSELLRRDHAGLCAARDVAGLTGEAWLPGSIADLDQPRFQGEAAGSLLELPTATPTMTSGLDIDRLLAAVRNGSQRRGGAALMWSLAWPWALLALPLPFLCARCCPSADPAGAGLRVPSLDGFDAADRSAAEQMLNWRSGSRACLVLLVLAAARPERSAMSSTCRCPAAT